MEYCKRNNCPGTELGILIKILTIFLVILSGVLMIIDVVAIIDIKNDEKNYNESGLIIKALCGMMILCSHFSLSLISLFNAVSLLNILDARTFRFIKCRQWSIITTQFLCLESLNIFIFLFFGTTATYFVVFGNLAVTFKLYMLWPLKRFTASIRNCSECVILYQ